MNKGLLIGLAAAVGIGGFIMWKKKHASAPSTTPDTSSDKKEDKKDDKKATPPVNSKVGTTTPKKAPAPAQDVPYDVLTDADYAEKKKLIYPYSNPSGNMRYGTMANSWNDLYKMSLDDIKKYISIVHDNNGADYSDMQNRAIVGDIMNRNKSVFSKYFANKERWKNMTPEQRAKEIGHWRHGSQVEVAKGITNFTGNPIFN